MNSVLDKINTLWNSDSGELAKILDELIVLLRQAEQRGEKLPVELKRDIIIQANYSNGFGSQISDAGFIIKFLDELYTSNKDKQFYRYTALASSAILSSLSLDEQNNTRHTASLLDIDTNSSRSALIRHFVYNNIKYLNGERSQWWYENISFSIIFMAIIKIIGGWNETDEQQFNNLIGIISKDDQQTSEFIDWKSSWVEKNDYFRFNSLLITDKHASEDLLMEMFQKICE